MHKKVEVFWRDATYLGGWKSLEEIKEEANSGEECSTMGYLIEDGSERLVIAQTTGRDVLDHLRGNIWILPRSMVTRIVEQTNYTPIIVTYPEWKEQTP